MNLTLFITLVCLLLSIQGTKVTLDWSQTGRQDIVDVIIVFIKGGWVTSPVQLGKQSVTFSNVPLEKFKFIWLDNLKEKRQGFLIEFGKGMCESNKDRSTTIRIKSIGPLQTRP